MEIKEGFYVAIILICSIFAMISGIILTHSYEGARCNYATQKADFYENNKFYHANISDDFFNFTIGVNK